MELSVFSLILKISRFFEQSGKENMEKISVEKPRKQKLVLVCNSMSGFKFCEKYLKYGVYKRYELAVDLIDASVDSGNYIVRYPLRPGFESYSIDGKRVAPLMGEHKDYENDYETDRLAEFWNITGGQDWVLCENNQKGILSDKYKHGIISPDESDVMNFHQWYLHRMKKKVLRQRNRKT